MIKILHVLLQLVQVIFLYDNNLLRNSYKYYEVSNNDAFIKVMTIVLCPICL
jgi:hypothetical protein